MHDAANNRAPNIVYQCMLAICITQTGVDQVAEVDAANLELEDANTRLEALASAADEEKAALSQRLNSLQGTQDVLESQVGFRQI